MPHAHTQNLPNVLSIHVHNEKLNVLVIEKKYKDGKVFSDEEWFILVTVQLVM